MDFYFERLKKELKNAYYLDMDFFENPNRVYNRISKKISDVGFNNTYNDLFCAFCLYIYNKTDSLQTLTSQKLPVEIKKGEEPNEFFNKLKQCDKYPIEKSFYPNDNYCKMLFRCLASRKKIDDEYYWIGISKKNLESTNNPGLPPTYQIYLPIANESLHKFISIFFPLCEGRNIDYHFKINNSIFFSNSDNVIIYANDGNLKDYIAVIEEVLKIQPDIKINYEQLHVLAYPYNNHIAIAPNKDYDGKSFSELICIQICDIRKTSANFEEFFEKVKTMMQGYFSNFNIQFNQTFVGEPGSKKIQ